MPGPRSTGSGFEPALRWAMVAATTREDVMAYEDYKLIRFAREGKIVTATVDAPPINIITLELYAELARMSQDVADNAEALVFVMKSANPDFFLAHFDVAAILQFPIDKPAQRETS